MALCGCLRLVIKHNYKQICAVSHDAQVNGSDKDFLV